MSTQSHEVYRFLRVSFDVTRAQEILRDREAVRIPVKKRACFHALDEHYAMSSKNTDPILFAQFPRAAGGTWPLLIDGHHRNYRATRLGQETILAKFLTEDETRSILRGDPSILWEYLRLLDSGSDFPTKKEE